MPKIFEKPFHEKIKMREKIELMIKACVHLLGERAIDDPFLTQHLTLEELESLMEIVQDPEHPFMKEHKRRGEELENKVEKIQNEAWEKELRKQELKNGQNAKEEEEELWNQKSTAQKFFWYTFRIIMWFLIILFMIFILLTIPGQILF